MARKRKPIVAWAVVNKNTGTVDRLYHGRLAEMEACAHAYNVNKLMGTSKWIARKVRRGK